MTDEKQTIQKRIDKPIKQATDADSAVSRNQRHKKQTESGAGFWTRFKAKRPRKEQNEKPEVPVSELKWVGVRMFPIWLRLLILLVALVLAAVIGAIIGFSIIGDGSAVDVFRKETWQHIFDIMNGK